MAQHAQLRVDTNPETYFCNPSSPWQCGTNEITNGLLRQYFPKGTDISKHSRADLEAVAKTLNTRPRKTLGKLLQKRLTFSYHHFRNVLHQPVEFAQYASGGFRTALHANGIYQSVLGKGNCYDNAVVESFFAALKTEEVEGADYQTRQ